MSISSFRGTPPCGSTRYMLCSPVTRESNAINLPSGAQRGVPVMLIPNDVSWTGLEPSASQTHISLEPVLLDSKAILLPSGEIFGAFCSRDETTSFWLLGGDASRSRRQMFTLVNPCT